MTATDPVTTDVVQRSIGWQQLHPYLHPRFGQRNHDAHCARMAVHDRVGRYRDTPGGLASVPKQVRVAALIVRAWAEARTCVSEADALCAAGEVHGVLRAAHYLGYGTSVVELHRMVLDVMRTVGAFNLQIEEIAERLEKEAWD